MGWFNWKKCQMTPKLIVEKLDWKPETGNIREARIGVDNDCVIFHYQYMPTNYRRGPHRLLIEVCGGENHEKWGCFDEPDQPTRYFQSEQNLKEEALLLAQVLLTDRVLAGSAPWFHPVDPRT